MLALSVFSVELIASSIGREDYAFSFFFYLDLIATLSLIIDITTVAESLSGGDGSSAASYSQNATDAARLLRILRLIRLFRIVKLYKQYMERQQRKKIKAALERKRQREAEEGYSSRVAPGSSGGAPGENDELLDFDDDELAGFNEEEKYHSKQESRVGRKLSDMTTRRVIVLVLGMLLFVPQFQPLENFMEYQSGNQYAQDIIHVLAKRMYAANND